MLLHGLQKRGLDTTMTTQLCVICGERAATTKDHLPPAGLFPKPRPSDLVTVPCCRECNTEASKWDERFRVFAAMHVSRNDPEATELLHKSVLPSVRHNARLRREILESARDVMLTTPSGIVLGPATQVHWDSEAYDRVIERVVRGLHFHHTGEILGQRARVKVHFLRDLNGIGPVLEQLPLHSIGGGQFLYKVIHHPDLPLRSLWVFEYRGWMWSGGYVEPITPTT